MALGAADNQLLLSTLDTLRRCLEFTLPQQNCVAPAAPAARCEPVVEDAQEPETSQWPGDQHMLTEDEVVVVGSERSHTIHIQGYKDETQIGEIMRLITKDLSEPYSIYTYRYFIHNWPELCLLAWDSVAKQLVGAVICKLDTHQDGRRRGYIAMLAVDDSCRRLGIGTKLVRRAIETMQKSGCDEVVLETEVTNKDAMRLYSNLGFIREKRLFRYYLNGVDAFRLKLYFSAPPEGTPPSYYSPY